MVSALIDTGASISCLSEITYQQLIQQKNLIKVMKINDKTCVLADDTEVVVNRLAIIPFNIKGTEIQLKLHILPMNHIQIILGCDLLSLLNASISYINKEITFIINNANITQLQSNNHNETLGHIDIKYNENNMSRERKVEQSKSLLNNIDFSDSDINTDQKRAT